MNNYFSENIRSLRKEREMTQEALADFLGVSFQAVSKWERGESYPDIELLPTIADFFDVTTDHLLGVDSQRNEEDILAYIDRFDNGKYKSSEGSLSFMAEAFGKYPSDFRILVRYMNALMDDGIRENNPLKSKKEIMAIYERIQDFCTSDRIRMRAKTLIINYYRYLIPVKNSGVTEQDMFKLIDEMPGIPDSKEYMLGYLPLDPDATRQGCQKLFDSLLFCFDQAVSHYTHTQFLYGKEPSSEEINESIKALEMMNGIYESVYSDGNYGKSWLPVIYNYGYLGQYYHRLGNDEKALENLKRCAELAKKFDTMPDITERTALLFKGSVLNKQEDVNVLLDASLRKHMTHHMLDNYPLSDEFKAKPEFKVILDIMK
ncbi:MAG: helix-turn-helix transcriptional regulator [Clostridia bacterium]|nr:helix-turn-helix transcriptional regulator [Clostridia bacterium]